MRKTALPTLLQIWAYGLSYWQI